MDFETAKLVASLAQCKSLPVLEAVDTCNRQVAHLEQRISIAQNLILEARELKAQLEKAASSVQPS